ncbi:hypothetical protein FS837_012491 [Tulasnella sp. UAMH 9824]|nr:hypothetical protein FS837_012491 [Tulasnella sp. UAMH 9824]
MESIPSLNDVIEQLQYQQSGYWLAAGGAALFFYDWLLCLDREIQYVWKPRWSFGKVWFICHRYAMMLLVIGVLYGSVKSSSESSSPESGAKGVNILFNAFGPGAMKTWMVNYTGPLLSSMATRLVLNFHDQMSQTAHYPTDSPTRVCEGRTNAFSTVEFAVPAVTRDVESIPHDMYGGESSTDDRTRTGDGDEEGNAFELKALKEEDGKE